MSNTPRVMDRVLDRLKYMGYDASVVDFLQMKEESGTVEVSRYPNVDDYNGVSASLLHILIRDIDRVVDELNKERGMKDGN